jgi:hypothetical protein
VSTSRRTIAWPNTKTPSCCSTAVELNVEADGSLRLAANLTTDRRPGGDREIDSIRQEVRRVDAAELAAASSSARPLDLLAEPACAGPSSAWRRGRRSMALVKQVTVFTDRDERGRKSARLVFSTGSPPPTVTTV